MQHVKEQLLRLSADVGGTFTDIVLECGPSRWTGKLPTTPSAPEQAVLDGMRGVLSQAGRRIADLDRVVHGTTLPTNAVIERRGARTALIATDGFRDVLEIGTEGRYDQYELALVRPRPLVERPLRFTVRERIDAKGRVRLALDETHVLEVIEQLRANAVESVAVAFMHAYANPAHELRVRELLLERMPTLEVSLSSDICPEIREYERTSTTVLNAYVQPIMAGYLRRLEDQLRAEGFQGSLLIMTSGGSLTSVDIARRFPVRLIESGPAGGALYAANSAARAGENHVMAFDMGGTTAKLCIINDQAPEKSRLFEADRAARFLKGSGLPVRVPVIDLVEIGAGGGSIASVDALGRVRVGPRSASSLPGPACYAKGGTHATVTDADLAIGLIESDRFAGGSMPLSVDAARQALHADVGRHLNLDACASAFAVYETVCESMASAARVHAIERGAAIGRYTMVVSGGAAPLHAARVAEKIGISRIVVPPDAGVGSAVGFLLAPVGFEVVRSMQMRLDQFDFEAALAITRQLKESVRAKVIPHAGGADVDDVCTAFMRYVGQGYELALDVTAPMRTGTDAAQLRCLFEAAYRKLFSRSIPDAQIEIVNWSVAAATRSQRPAIATAVHASPAPAAGRWATVYDGRNARTIEVPCYPRRELKPGTRLHGPALIVEDQTTTYVTASFRACIDGAGAIVLERELPPGGHA
ncbi:hydantoinase/oxoprolinase family protein [Hydrogenophaga sp.]|uniref:hydantoinase/oxoprolinase family protein n=1 Tax=Hydrogenophaga sp. TaxID=1904254 RepID=UPI0027169F15|nr:hydantoinase/oxoprolinase family protein [Hydrogenophaga sp.]MDO9433829.1 hydantoinase/oxoprolinase family protein [Hydrogenophaga sp.]